MVKSKVILITVVKLSRISMVSYSKIRSSAVSRYIGWGQGVVCSEFVMESTTAISHDVLWIGTDQPDFSRYFVDYYYVTSWQDVLVYGCFITNTVYFNGWEQYCFKYLYDVGAPNNSIAFTHWWQSTIRLAPHPHLGPYFPIVHENSLILQDFLHLKATLMIGKSKGSIQSEFETLSNSENVRGYD